MNESKEATLVVVGGADAGKSVPLGDQPILIGRDPQCDLPLRDDYASRQHCWVEQRDGRWWVRDLGSVNGTWVGNEQVVLEQPLSGGDVIGVGQSRIELRAEGQGNGVEPATTEAPPHRLWVDEKSRAAGVDGMTVQPPLSRKQWALLRLLWSRRGAVVTTAEIVRDVWPEAERPIPERQVDKLVGRLRARLGPAGDELIETVWGSGYRLRA